jgi:2-polyprenyl-3-methyl-5-hydroxy-6-metoxy-1,4-benzoquinol methylase
VIVMRLPARSTESERMDVERVSRDDLARALADLEWLAGFGGYHRPVLAWLDRIAAGRASLSVLDVASGGGDMLRRIARWGRRRGIALTLEGVDLNPDCRAIAEAAREDWMPITHRTADVFALGDTVAPDVIISSHFAHHLDDADLVRFLAWMEATARLGWFVNDLHRHWLMLAGIRVITRLLPFHRFVRSDGPISVRRSLVREEWEAAIAAAGIDRDRVAIRWHLPFRWGVGTCPG